MVEQPRDLDHIARSVRRSVLNMVHRGKAAHLASALSCVDLLVAAYWGPYTEEDSIIFSKGHAVSALYGTLAERGVFPMEWLEEFNHDGGRLPEQPSPGSVPGIEFAAGSLGHGLPFGLGVVLGSRIQKRLDKRVLVVMSDGECQEGSVWEAAMLAPKHGCGRLTVIIDKNGWQATGRTQEITGLDPLPAKWEAFGWKTVELGGHDYPALTEALNQAYLETDRPTAIIANTVKGRGVSFMEDDNNWHYRVPNAQELEMALAELA